MENQKHIPVLKKEVLFYLNCGPGKIFVDGTVGGGGHTQAILEASAPNGFVIGLDVDGEALIQAKKKLAPYGERYILKKGNYARGREILSGLNIEKVDGFLLDLGISSLQLAAPERGFSFLHPGPLDMRMDNTASVTASQIINRWSQKRIAEIIKQYGEERWANRIARKITETRVKMPIKTTTQLAEIVANAIPRRNWPRHIHPATRTFQALRIVVNQELENLKQFLNQVLSLLAPKGRVVIISFHSLEDRLVKNAFRNWAKEGKVQLLTKKPVQPSREELAMNPRARSAKLRAIEFRP